jgi:hypothetical protein
MNKSEIKKGKSVVDRSSPDMGSGIIKEVKKTVFKVDFGGKVLTYDYPHAQFLDTV